MTWLEDINAYQYWTGSSWQGSTPGFVHLNTQPFSAVTSVSFPNNSFTSAFDAYKVIFVHESGSASQNVTFRLRASGTDDSASNYRDLRFQAFGGGSASDQVTLSGSSLYPGGRTGGQSELLIINPFKSVRTYYQISSGAVFVGGPNSDFTMTSGFFNDTKVFDSISFIPATGNFTGYMQLYGLRK
jgi:hypothetical protein